MTKLELEDEIRNLMTKVAFLEAMIDTFVSFNSVLIDELTKKGIVNDKVLIDKTKESLTQLYNTKMLLNSTCSKSIS